MENYVGRASRWLGTALRERNLPQARFYAGEVARLARIEKRAGLVKRAQQIDTRLWFLDHLAPWYLRRARACALCGNTDGACENAAKALDAVARADACARMCPDVARALRTRAVETAFDRRGEWRVKLAH